MTEEKAPPNQENAEAAYESVNQPDDEKPKPNPNPKAKPKPKQKQPPPDGEGEFGVPLKRYIWIGTLLLSWCLLAVWMPIFRIDSYANYCQKEFGCNDTSSTAQCVAQCQLLIDTNPDTFKISQHLAVYSLLTIGILCMAAGVILGFFGVKKLNILYCQITIGLLCIGSFLSIFASLLEIATQETPEGVTLSLLIFTFIEVTIPSLVAILLACDVFNPLFLNSKRSRMVCYSVIFIIFGLMGGIVCAYIANYDVMLVTQLKHEFGCMAAGYFFIAIFSILRILIIKGNIVEGKNLILAKLAVAISLLVVGAGILTVGYCAFIGTAYNDIIWTSNMKEVNICYYVGYTMFVLGIVIVNCIDMEIVQNFKAFREAQASDDDSNDDESNDDDNSSKSSNDKT